MKKCFAGIVILAVVAGAISANGARVSQQQAAHAAKAWASSGVKLGVRVGQNVEKTVTLTTGSGHTFHAVKFSGGGTVFTSADTESEPIVAFTSSGDDFSKMPTNSPLYRLLSRDAEVRANIRAAKSGVARAAGFSTKTATAAAPVSLSSSRWAKLLSVNLTAKTTPADPITDAGALNDIRVAPLVETRWSQTTANLKDDGEECYNYYTPWTMGGNGQVRAPSGCTATALAQTMRYFKYPKYEVPSETALCTVDGREVLLQTVGGFFKWDEMIAEPHNGCTEDNREAIGHLTYDVGVLIGSDYTAFETGALLYKIPSVLRDNFGYSSSRCFWKIEQLYYEAGESEDGRPTTTIGLHNAKIRRNVIYTNLDNRRPVILAIFGYDAGYEGNEGYWGGHAVVGDGYGMVNYADDSTGEITNSVEYVHLNMGWGGQYDAWYNIPDVEVVDINPDGTESGNRYTVLAGAIYNIYTNETGEIVSGRVFDENGNPKEGVIVSVGNRSARSDSAGIYSLVLPSNDTYELNAISSDSRYVGSTTITVGKSYSSSDSGNEVTDVGNRWGVDINLELSVYADSVRRVKTGELYCSLIDAQNAIEPNETIEVIKPTLIDRSFSFVKPFTLTATNVVAQKSPVYIREGVAVDVSQGRLNLTNIVFCGEPSTVYTNLTGNAANIGSYTNITVYAAVSPIAVAAGAKVALSGTVGLPGLQLAGADCFELAGAIDTPVSLNVGTMVSGDKVGFATCGEEAALMSVGCLINPEDPYLAAQPTPYPDLRWALKPVADGDLVATLQYSGATETYRYDSFDRMLLDVTNSATISIKKPCSITKPFTVKGFDLTVTGDPLGYTPIDEIGPEAGFRIEDGGSLCVSNVMFMGYTGNGLFIVDGEGAKLELARNVHIYGANGTNVWSGAVSVLKGEATMRGSCAITQCASLGGGISAGNGGAVYLQGEGCALNLVSGEGDGRVQIKDCTATGSGGAVYAGRRSVVNLSGLINIGGCSSSVGGRGKADNIFLDSNSSTSAVVNVTGPLYNSFAMSSIPLRYYMKSGSYGNVAGCRFAVNGCAPDVATNNTQAFVSDVDGELDAVLSDDLLAYVWQTPAADSASTERGPWDVVRLIRADGQTTNYYMSVSAAVSDLGEGPEIMEILGDAEIDAMLEISGELLVRSDRESGAIATLRRGGVGLGIDVKADASLTLENIVVAEHEMIISSATRGLINVNGGSLVLGDGASVINASGSSNRASGGITVWNLGSITMLSGSVVSNCCNYFVNQSNASSVGGGILIDNGYGYFRGGKVSGCKAYRAAGVFAGNGATVEISGDFTAEGNFALDGRASDVVVERDASLVMRDVISGEIGVDFGISVDTNVFGTVAAAFAGSEQSLTNSAARFTCNASGAYGVIAVKSGSGVTNLVWSSAFDGNGIYTDKNGAQYSAVLGIPPPPPTEDVVEWADPDPIAFSAVFVKDGMWTIKFTNAVEWCNYSIYATNSLTGGFVIDGVEPVTNFQWKSQEKEASIQIESQDGAMFWKAVGEKGQIEKN